METLKSTPTTIAKHKLTIELATEGFFFVKAQQMEHHMVRRLPGVIDDVGMTDYTLGATSIRRGDQYFPRLMNKTITIDATSARVINSITTKIRMMAASAAISRS